MRVLLPLLAVSLLAAAGPAAAQAPAPQPPAAQTPATPAAAPAERPPLILHLDDDSRRRIMSGSSAQETSRGGDALPSLGGDARTVDLKPPPEAVFPKESGNKNPAPY